MRPDSTRIRMIYLKCCCTFTWLLNEFAINQLQFHIDKNAFGRQNLIFAINHRLQTTIAESASNAHDKFSRLLYSFVYCVRFYNSLSMYCAVNVFTPTFMTKLTNATGLFYSGICTILNC